MKPIFLNQIVVVSRENLILFTACNQWYNWLRFSQKIAAKSIRMFIDLLQNSTRSARLEVNLLQRKTKSYFIINKDPFSSLSIFVKDSGAGATVIGDSIVPYSKLIAFKISSVRAILAEKGAFGSKAQVVPKLSD